MSPAGIAGPGFDLEPSNPTYVAAQQLMLSVAGGFLLLHNHPRLVKRTQALTT